MLWRPVPHGRLAQDGLDGLVAARLSATSNLPQQGTVGLYSRHTDRKNSPSSHDRINSESHAKEEAAVGYFTFQAPLSLPQVR